MHIATSERCGFSSPSFTENTQDNDLSKKLILGERIYLFLKENAHMKLNGQEGRRELRGAGKEYDQNVSYEKILNKKGEMNIGSVLADCYSRGLAMNFFIL